MQHRSVLMSTLLAGVAGWVDSLGFFALAGVFTAHLTGNLVLVGAELVRAETGLLPKLLVFPAFFVGVALAALIHAHRNSRGLSSVGPVLLAEALALIGFMVAGLFARPVQDAGGMGPLAIVAVMLGAVAMGVQNGEGRLALRKLGSTAVMTTNITQLMLDTVSALHGRSPDRASSALRMRRLALPIAAFSACAVAAGFIYRELGFWGLLPPIVVLLVLAWRAE